MSLRILHFSDTHEGAILSPASFLDKRLIGCANSLLIRARRYNRELLRQGVNRILQERPDVIVYTGDAVSTSSPAEFDRAFELLRPLAESGIPLIYTPGNHDRYVRNPRCFEAMKKFYKSMNGGRDYSPEPYLFRIGGVRFAVIHCAIPTSWFMSSGKMTDRTLKFMEYEGNRTQTEPLVCTGHFPLLKDDSVFAFRRKLYGAEKASELLSSGKIALSLCGHVHRGYDRLDERGYGEICAGSLTKHGEMAEITFEAGKFSVKRWTLS